MKFYTALQLLVDFSSILVVFETSIRGGWFRLPLNLATFTPDKVLYFGPLSYCVSCR